MTTNVRFGLIFDRFFSYPWKKKQIVCYLNDQNRFELEIVDERGVGRANIEVVFAMLIALVWRSEYGLTHLVLYDTGKKVR